MVFELAGDFPEYFVRIATYRADRSWCRFLIEIVALAAFVVSAIGDDLLWRDHGPCGKTDYHRGQVARCLGMVLGEEDAACGVD